MPLIDGKLIARNILGDLSQRVKKLKQRGSVPLLAVILVGNDKPSLTYVKKKGEAAKKVGIGFTLHHLPPDATEREVLSTLERVQSDPALSGLIVQLPLPRHLDTEKILSHIHPEYDVDCLTPLCIAQLESGNPTFIPPTPGAILSILESLHVQLNGARVAVFGRGPLVGKPIATLLRQAGAEVEVIHSKTENPQAISRSADIVISGIGKKIVTGDMIREGAIVIDAGTLVEDGAVSGDVDIASVEPKAAFVTPTPGGVGPITVARLLWNTVLGAERRTKG